MPTAKLPHLPRRYALTDFDYALPPELIAQSIRWPNVLPAACSMVAPARRSTTASSVNCLRCWRRTICWCLTTPG